MNLWGLVDAGLDMVKAVGMVTNPIAGGVLEIIDAVVEKKADGVSNDSVKKMIVHSAQSTWNSLDDQAILEMFQAINRAKERKKKVWSDDLLKIKQELNEIEGAK